MSRADSPDAEIDSAIEVFVRSWCVSRSRTHPYVAERDGSAWVMRDAPRSGTNPKYRRQEWVARASAARDTADRARRQARVGYAICIVRSLQEPADAVRQEYKELGFRFGGTEALMVHPLTRIPRLTTSYEITRVKSAALADKLAQVRGTRPRADLLSSDSSTWQYVALDDGEPVGWAESIITETEDPDPRAWCENMFVAPTHRRQGIAKALLARMLRDDRRRGARASVLLASHAGAQLYPSVGYRQIGELLLFTPPKIGG